MLPSRHQIEELASALGGLPVFGCLPGSTSDLAVVRYGDVVLAVNGVPTKDVGEYMAAKRLRADGYDLRLFRDGTEFSLYVPFGPAMDPETVIAALIDRASAEVPAPAKVLS